MTSRRSQPALILTLGLLGACLPPLPGADDGTKHPDTGSGDADADSDADTDSDTTDSTHDTDTGSPDTRRLHALKREVERGR